MIGHKNQSEYEKDALGYLFVIQTHVLICAKENIFSTSTFAFLNMLLFLNINT